MSNDIFEVCFQVQGDAKGLKHARMAELEVIAVRRREKREGKKLVPISRVTTYRAIEP